ncbi:MAG: PrsW family intramembrane metalloprotease [Lentisphaeria bacterium]|nr:PrsW family intramembrane metalloprotease [Lentisphaeria bacterium]NQZ70936.1 PrsW family intramembrane metalloprotease [Lentisphaeria bacterium]
MTLFFICSWACFLIFAWLISKKFDYTKPHIGIILLFIFFGCLSVLAPTFTNTILAEKTQLSYYGMDPVTTALSMWLGPGLCEELSKMICVLLPMSLLFLLDVKIGKHGRILYAVIVAMTFSIIENLIYATWMELSDIQMIRRGCTAVPLHASMGYMHGIAINVAFSKRSIVPLLVGFFVTSILHAFYNASPQIIYMLVSSLTDLTVIKNELMLKMISWVMIPTVCFYSAFCCIHWLRINELSEEIE